jgi:hypothetical protein
LLWIAQADQPTALADYALAIAIFDESFTVAHR